MIGLRHADNNSLVRRRHPEAKPNSQEQIGPPRLTITLKYVFMEGINTRLPPESDSPFFLSSFTTLHLPAPTLLPTIPTILNSATQVINTLNHPSDKPSI
ncbi:hypothetical protein NXS19_010469 [Fusarium pseudograminearum]|nr:hypothetical protein NXS19_010469 [Fusarium pseudograminearum]